MHHSKTYYLHLLSKNINEYYTQTVIIINMEKRNDINADTGLKKYGNVEFADNINKKYPLDTEEHIRAAWNYFHIQRDYDKYSDADRKVITNKIIKAWKEKISTQGPPKKH